MKKTIMTIGAFLALTAASAQGGYASFSLGYAGGNSNVIGVSTVYDSDGNYTKSSIKGTFGKGIPINLAAGFMFNKHVGAELGATYYNGLSVTSEETTTPTADYSKTSSVASQIRILPQLVVSSGTEGVLEFYAKGGLIIPIGGSTDFKIEGTSGSGTLLKSTQIYEGTISGKFGLGYTGTIGAALNLSDNISIFGEFQGITLNVKRDKMELTSATINGIDIKPLIEKQFNVNYVDELSSTTTTTDVLRTPSEVVNYNSVGINIGIKLKF